MLLQVSKEPRITGEAATGAVAHKVAVEYGSYDNRLLGTTIPKQLERTPALVHMSQLAPPDEFFPTCAGMRARTAASPVFLAPCKLAQSQ